MFGFATVLIFEFLEILVRERREDLARKNYKPAASFPRSMWQLSAGWPEDTVRKNFPVLKTIHPIRKKQDAQKLVLIGTEVNASFAADSFLHSRKLFFPLPPKSNTSLLRPNPCNPSPSSLSIGRGGSKNALEKKGGKR